MSEHCAFIKANGERCRAHPITGDRFCISHSPDPRAKRIKAEAVSRGGKGRARGESIDTWSARSIVSMEDLRAALSELLNAGMLGDVPTSRLSALASVANSLTRVLEQGQLEKRIEALEAEAGRLRR